MKATERNNAFGWGIDDCGKLMVAGCRNAAFHISLDRADEIYWASIGYDRMAASSRRKAEQRLLLMGWHRDDHPPYGT